MFGRNNGEKSRKRNVISELTELYNIKSAEDIQDALKDLLGETIEDMPAGELKDKSIKSRNTLKYVSDKDKKEISKDLKTIYHAPSESLRLLYFL
ncbi:MAG: hypothetical protein LBV03_04210 [Fusobacteriales bacterium]|jgi:hypothetical protein|nr:hypothetical protein [Fusobacteriales bacterium]